MKRIAVVLLVALVCCSCEKSNNFKPTFPVKGVILVDDQPVEQLAVKCESVEGMDKASPTVSNALTKKDGSFEIATYMQGDGVPVGRYVLTFQWGKRNLLTAQYSGDKFNGKYADPKTSEYKFEVKEGVPTDLGTIKLTTASQ